MLAIGLTERRVQPESCVSYHYLTPDTARRFVDPFAGRLLESDVLVDPWRYRLGVRMRGSQPRDRGSIPRTATKL